MGRHVTDESWFGRIGGAIKGILFGGILAIVSVPLLFWNEGRAVRTAKGLKEGASIVVEVNPDSIDSANEGKFVHSSGDIATDDVLEDADFGISYNGIRLTRHVEMYQWDEDRESRTEKKLGGGKRTITEFTYHKDWHEGLIDSDRFDEPQHKNPDQMLFAPQVQQADNVRLGQFRLPDSLVTMVSGNEPIELVESNIPPDFTGRATIRRDGPEGATRLYISGSWSTSTPPNALPVASAPTSENPISEAPAANPNRPGLVDLESGLGNQSGNETPANPNRPDLIDLENEPELNSTPRTALDSEAMSSTSDPTTDPQIGDVRVWFTATPVTDVSLLSQQTGDSFQPYETQYGTNIHTLKIGLSSAAEMIAQQEAANRAMTWLLRGIGTFVMFLGFVLILRPLAVIADVLPIAGSLGWLWDSRCRRIVDRCGLDDRDWDCLDLLSTLAWYLFVSHRRWCDLHACQTKPRQTRSPTRYIDVCGFGVNC